MAWSIALSRRVLCDLETRPNCIKPWSLRCVSGNLEDLPNYREVIPQWGAIVRGGVAPGRGTPAQLPERVLWPVRAMRAACLVSGCRPLHTAGMHQHTPGSAHGGQHVAHTLLRIRGRPSHTPGADSASSPRPVPSGARGSGRWSCRHPHSQGTAGCNAGASAPGLHQGRHRRRRYSSGRSHTAPRCRKSVCLDLRLPWMRRDQLLCMPRWRPPWSTTLRV
jgi:hypothetical protein